MAENKYKSKSNNSDMLQKINELYGRVPPQALDLEEVILGALLIDSEAIFLVIEILVPESFYKPEHQIIYSVIWGLNNTENAKIDILTVTEGLRKIDKLSEVGGASYLASLTSRVATAAHLEFHARIIHQKYLQRRLIDISTEIQKKSYDNTEDVDELINFAEQKVFEISEGNIKKDSLPIGIVVKEAFDEIYRASKSDNKFLGVPSGYTELDRITSGWQKSDLIILAARPSMGKTAFVLNMARNIAVESNRPVAVFSLEMSNMQLANRLISAEVEISGDKVRTGNLEDYEWKQLENRIKVLDNAPIFVDDTPAISIFELRAKARRLVQTHKIQAIIIDYLQLMTAGVNMKGNREQEVSTISRSLKALAKDLEIPIIALSQLNRSVETRSTVDKRPQLSDLRESGAIEQDADLVLFIHRPEYYGLVEDKEGTVRTGQAEIIIAKHRNGAVGSCWLRFRQEFAKFSDVGEEIVEYDNSSGNQVATYKSKGFNETPDAAINPSNDFENSPF